MRLDIYRYRKPSKNYGSRVDWASTPLLVTQSELDSRMAKTLRVLLCLFSRREGIKQSKRGPINCDACWSQDWNFPQPRLVVHTASLRADCGCWPHGLLCWREHDQGYTDDNQRSRGTQQFSTFARHLEGLHHHNSGMGKARPCCKGDQAAIRGWVTRCQQHENPERDIDAKHHRHLSFRRMGLP